MPDAIEPISAGGGTCPAHHEMALGTCPRCGAFVCGRCIEAHPAERLCEACGERADTERAERRLRRFTHASWMIPVGQAVLNAFLLRRVFVLAGCISLLATPLGIWCALNARSLAKRRGFKPSFALYVGYALNLLFLLSFISGLIVGFAVGRHTSGR
jgi:hypothetical protein